MKLSQIIENVDYSGLEDDSTMMNVCYCCGESLEDLDFTKCLDCDARYCEECAPGGTYWQKGKWWEPPKMRRIGYKDKFEYHEGVLSGEIVIHSCPECS